jgi:hypothetical protein
MPSDKSALGEVPEDPARPEALYSVDRASNKPLTHLRPGFSPPGSPYLDMSF